MAIKIIKNTMTEPIQKECEWCHSIFEFNYQDIEVQDFRSILGTNIRKRIVVCPVCKFANDMTKICVESSEGESIKEKAQTNGKRI